MDNVLIAGASPTGLVKILFKDAGVDMTPYPFVTVYPQDQHEPLSILPGLLDDRILPIVVETNNVG